MEVINLGVAAFWIFLAAIIIASIWRKKHREALRHETVRFLIEKNQKIDDAQLTQLLNPPPPPSPEWLVGHTGDGYRVLRIFGTIIMFIALGLGLVFLWRGMMLGFHEKSVMEFGTAIPLVAVLGAGLFVASRFVTPPPSSENKNKQVM
jgi:hypothetical protein